MELKTKTFVFIVVGFLLGGIAGGFIGKTYFVGQGGNRRTTRAEMQKQFAERLQLTTVQSTKVDSLLEVYRQNFTQVQNQYWHLYRLKRDTLRMSMRALLTPEQNKLFDDYIKEADQREAKRHEGSGR